MTDTSVLAIRRSARIAIKPATELFPVRLMSPSLYTKKNGDIVLRGVLDNETLVNLKVDVYQRERQSPAQRRPIMEGFESGGHLPDIDLGMRGDKFDMPDGDHVAVLLDPVYIIDGLQRRDTLLEYLERHPLADAALGASVLFNTTQEIERKLFAKFNQNRLRVSASKLLHNDKEDSPFLGTLYGLTQQPSSVLYGKICWSQKRVRGELITGLVYVLLTFDLHFRFTPIAKQSKTMIADGARLIGAVGLANIRMNTDTFWRLVDEAWGLRGVAYSSRSPQLRRTFLRTLARLLADFRDFWSPEDNKRLFIPVELRHKFKKFDLGDPERDRLTGSSGAAGETLYYLLARHLNSGKRTKRLTPWVEVRGGSDATS